MQILSELKTLGIRGPKRLRARVRAEPGIFGSQRCAEIQGSGEVSLPAPWRGLGLALLLPRPGSVLTPLSGAGRLTSQYCRIVWGGIETGPPRGNPTCQRRPSPVTPAVQMKTMEGKADGERRVRWFHRHRDALAACQAARCLLSQLLRWRCQKIDKNKNSGSGVIIVGTTPRRHCRHCFEDDFLEKQGQILISCEVSRGRATPVIVTNISPVLQEQSCKEDQELPKPTAEAKM